MILLHQSILNLYRGILENILSSRYRFSSMVIGTLSCDVVQVVRQNLGSHLAAAPGLGLCPGLWLRWALPTAICLLILLSSIVQWSDVFIFPMINNKSDSKRLKSTFFICLPVWSQSWQGFHSRSCSSLASSLEALSLLSLRLRSWETWISIIWHLDLIWF